MKKLMTILVLCLSVCAYGQDWGWKEIGKGAQAGYAQFEMFGTMQSVSVVRYRASRHRTEIVNDPAAMADSTSALAVRHGGLGAVNGSYFNVKELTPVTFVKDDGVREGSTTAEEAFRADGIVAVKGKHKVVVMSCDTSSYDAVTRRYREVLASGPVLLQDGRPVHEDWPDDSFFTSRHPRTLMGTTADGWVYFIVVDGRAWGQTAGTTIPETVQVAQMFGLDDAINLDGGGSSTLWTESLGVISHPCDNRKFDHYGQRSVPNVLIFR